MSKINIQIGVAGVAISAAVVVGHVINALELSAFSALVLAGGVAVLCVAAFIFVGKGV